MTDLQFERLCEFKLQFAQSQSGYINYISGPAVKRLEILYRELSGTDYSVSSYGCSSCIMKLVKLAAPYYFNEVKDRENKVVKEAVEDGRAVEQPIKKGRGRSKKEKENQ